MSRLLAVLALATLLSGCAHRIVITPDTARLAPAGVQPIPRNVGYVISPADRARTVETPGGGGDKVEYQPYAELEPALFKVLSTVFRRAYPLDSAADAATLQAKDISLVIVPSILTTSSSDSFITWAPTRFSVELTCQVLNRAGKVVWEKRVVGEGAAEYDEFKSDFSLAARRASLDALQKLQKELNGAAALRPAQASAIDRG